MNTHGERSESQDDPKLRAISDEIRRMGLPYSEEPDAGYFANFRVRVMDEIESREAGRRGFFFRFSQWLAERPLRSGIVGLTTVAIIVIGIFANPFTSTLQNNSNQVASNQTRDPQLKIANQPAVKDSTLKQPEQVKLPPPALKQTPDLEQKHQLAIDNNEVAKDQNVKKAINSGEQAADLASTLDSAIAKSSPEELAENLEATGGAAAISTSEADVPVSLSDLSESELESVLHNLEQSK